VKRFRMVAPVVLIVISAAASAADAQTVTLRYRWTKGETRTYRVATETNNAISGMPGAGDMSATQTMTQILKMVAEDVGADGTATLRQTFQSVRMEANTPRGKMVVDTAVRDPTPNPATEGTRRVLDAMVGESVTIVMTADGTLQSVAGASRIGDKITKLMSSDPSTGAAGQGLRTTLSDEALKNTLEQSFPKLAPGPLKVADTWSSQLTMRNAAIGRVVGTSTFTLRAIEGSADAPVARIGVGLTLKQEVVPPPSGPAGMVMKLRDNQGAGEMLFDVAHGYIQRSTMKTETTSNVTMNGPDGTPATMQNRTTTAMTMELVDK
jgi:uncharacterized protein DUF6263